MYNMALLLKEGENLVTYYILPLLGLNKKSYGLKYKTAFISKDSFKVYVELKSNPDGDLYMQNPYYITKFVHNGVLYLQYTVPSDNIEDYKHFIKGAYSKFSKDAKYKVYKFSTLPYNKSMGDFKMSHPILHALNSTKVLSVFLKSYIGEDFLADSGELIDAPHDDWFIESRI